MQEYGTRTPLHPFDELLAKSGLTEYRYVMYYDVIPINARPCQWPGSIKVQIIDLNSIPRTAIRLLDGSVRYENC